MRTSINDPTAEPAREVATSILKSQRMSIPQKSARTGSTARRSRAARVERKLHKKEKEHKDNPKKGVMWYLFYCCIKAAAMICSSLLFDLNKDL